MKLPKPGKRFAFITLSVLILGPLLFCGFAIYTLRQTKFSLVDDTPEKIFESQFLGGKPIPSEVNEIYAAEVYSFGGVGVLARFKATDLFINELLKTDYGFEGIYSSGWGCHDVFVDPAYSFLSELSEELDWWKPFDITSKKCYHAYTCQIHNEKFLLVDFDNNTIYFYRQVCGLCPGGDVERDLLYPQCQHYWDNYSSQED